MASPLDSTSPERRTRQNDFPSRARQTGRGLSRRLRAVLGAGLGAIGLVGAIVASPNAALAQDQKLTDSAQWALDFMQVPEAQETSTGEGVTVAVIDTGMGDHPFFEDKDVLPGYSIFSGAEDDAWHDRDGHGMAVAAGVLHVAPDATVLPVRYDNGNRELEIGGWGPTTVDSIRWSVDNGADVIVFAWGSEYDYEQMTEAMQYAIDSGVLVIASAGNDPESPPSYPANLPGVVAVTGVDQNGGAWYGSSVGPETVIAAPAENMLHPLPMKEDKGWGTEPEVEYDEGIAGTSVGAGFVGGVAALTLAAHSDLDANNVIQRLIQTAGDGSGSNRTDEMGFGLVNAERAVNADGIESVDENPLGYPMGEPGASGAGPEEDEGESEPEGSAENSADEPSAVEAEAASEESDSGLSTILVVAAAVVLIGAAVGVWLVLRGRGRKQADTAAAQASSSGYGSPYGGHQGSAPARQQSFGQQMPPGPQSFGGTLEPGPQNYGSPSGGAEPSPPWGPSDPNDRR